MTELVPIGRFARSVRLSVKALRRYQELGLLPAAHVDPDTGYRYYRPEQARDAVAIAMLRRLDVPLDEIRHILAEGLDEARLEVHRCRLERKLALQRAALSSVDRLLAEGQLFPYPVEVDRVPDRWVGALDVATTPERLELDTTEAVRRLLSELAHAGARDPVQCLLHDPTANEELAITVAVAIERATSDRPADVRLERLPGGTFARALHRGPYEALGLAHAAVFAWVRERSLSVSGPAREVYLDDPDEVDPSDLRTEVLLPFEPPRRK